MIDNLKLIIAKIQDVEEIVKYRMKLWDDVGKFTSNEEFKDLFEKNKLYISEKFKSNSLVVPIFMDSNKNIVSIGIGVIIDKPPINWKDSGKEGYIYNMFTEPKYRKMGLATTILNKIYDYFNNKGVTKVNLNSNEESCNLYKKNGMVGNPYYLEKLI